MRSSKLLRSSAVGARWPPAREIHLPEFASRVMYKFGDMISLLGWRPPVRSSAEREIRRGAVGNLEDTQQLGLHPKGLPEFFASEPASVQERWFARMYLLKPAMFMIISLFW